MTDARDRVLDQVLVTLRGSLDCSMITLGARLGCWDALAATPGCDTAELAAACAIHPRYAREWLEAMGAAGLLTVTTDDAATERRRFSLADGVPEVLVDDGSDCYLTPLLRQASAAAAGLRALEEAYRTGGGVPWAEHDPDMAEQQGAANKGQLRRHLAGWLRTVLPEVAARLDEGGRVADVGCGHGWASVGLAEAFPHIRVDAYDVDGPSVQAARRHVAEAGLAGRVTVHHEPLTGSGAYDLVVLAEMLHDVPDPVGVLADSRSGLVDGGTALVIDMKVGDSYTAPAGDVERMMYGFSTLICLPDSMATPGSAATGTVMRTSTLRRYAAEAGFGSVTELPVKHDTWRFYALGGSTECP